MAQNDNVKSNFNSPFLWVLALCTIVLVGFKSYDYYLTIELKQKQIQLTEDAKVTQDSIRAFVERGKLACRVCEDYKKNDPEKINEGLVAVGISLFIILLCCIFAWAFKDFS